MKKVINIKVGKDTNYTDVKRKVGTVLFEMEKETKIKDCYEVIIRIEVDR